MDIFGFIYFNINSNFILLYVISLINGKFWINLLLGEFLILGILNREFLGSTSNIRMSLNGVLAVIVSYCVVTKSYDKYEEMVKNMFSDVENISDKMEMNGIKV